MFSDTEKAVFKYSDGTQDLWVDPSIKRRQLLQASAGEFNTLLARCQPPPVGVDEIGIRAAEMGREDAEEKIILCVRQVFSMPEVDSATGKGCTEQMCWRVLTAFLAFLEGEPRPGGS